MNTKVETILKEILEERKYQADKFANGNEDELLSVDLKNNTPNDFVSYISHYSTTWFTGGFGPWSKDVLLQFRKSMIKTATLAIGAIIWVDAKIDELE